MNLLWRAGTFRCAEGKNEMRLTQWTDYTLRVLMYCAASDGRAQPVTVTEIAAAHGISRSHLTKIVMALAAQLFNDETGEVIVRGVLLNGSWVEADEHLLPLFFARAAGERFSLVHQGFTYGALGMDIYRFD